MPAACTTICTRCKFHGFMAAYVEGTDDLRAGAEDEEGEGKTLPELREGEALRLPAGAGSLRADQHFTEPPARFTESTLVKELEEKEIGRPSTYAQILSTLRDKDYVTMVERRFAPTDLGMLVNDLLVPAFPQVFDVGFTAQMEAELDRVEEGTRQWQDVLKDFYGPFRQALEHAGERMPNPKAACLSFSAGLPGDYIYAYVTQNRFTNMSVFALSTAVIIFMLGLISEQIALLRMERLESGRRDDDG